MGRRKSREGLMDVLVTLPWWVSAGLGVAGFVTIRWIVPHMFSGPVASIGLAMHSFAWMPLLVFGLTALIVRLRARKPPASSSTPLIDTKPGPGFGPQGQPGSQAESSSRAPTEWTLDALRAIEWKQFEQLCGKYYEAAGFQIRTVPFGPDGGIDIKLFRGNSVNPIALVQCKARTNTQVGVATVRELLGVMASEKVGRGILITTFVFSKEALAFAAANAIHLLNGSDFLQKLRDLPPVVQATLLEFAFEGDYATPSCASCGIKMVRRKGKQSDFHGCVNYPRCRNSLAIR